MAGTEDPDSGIADACPRHASEARGLPEGTRREPDTDGRANQDRVRYGGAPLRAPRQYLFFNLVCRISRGPSRRGSGSSAKKHLR